MSMPSARSLRSLEIDSFRRPSIQILLILALLTVWGGWLLLARVPIYASSSTARIEANGLLFPVTAAETQRIVDLNFQLGQKVAAGVRLVGLETGDIENERTAQQAHLTALLHQRAAAQTALASQHEEFARAIQLAQSAVDLARARYELAAAGASLPSTPTTIASLQADYVQLSWNQQVSANSWRIQLADLQRSVLTLDGEITTTQSTLATLAHRLDARSVRAPVTGTLIEAAALQQGEFVQAGQRLGVILAASTAVAPFKAVAYFSPQVALGRIHPGQHVYLRLDGFPWSQYGAIPAAVSNVAGEVRDQQVRVELTIAANAQGSIPLQHGLPGAVDIELERVSPLLILLRAAGRFINH